MTHLPSSVNKKFCNTLALVIIAAGLILAITSLWDDAPIVDEIPHIGAGYSYIAKGDHRLNPEHPPLAKDLAGIPLKLLGIPDEPAFQTKYWLKDVNGQWDFGRYLLYKSGGDAVKAVRYAKIPQLIFFVLSGILIFYWTRKIYSCLAALIALFLFSFSPTVLAHSRFVTTDMPALWGVLIASFFFIRYLEKPAYKNLLLAGLVFGVAQLTKFSVFLLAPFFLVLSLLYALLHSRSHKIKSTLYAIRSTILIMLIGYVCVVWPVYLFHVQNYPPKLQKFHTQDLLSSFGKRSLAEKVVYLSDKPILRGIAEYGLGLLMVVQRSVGGNTTYFLGEVRAEGWKYYFPIVYFIKEPLPFWGLVILIMLGIISARVKKYNLKIKKFLKDFINWVQDHFTEFAMFLWLMVYWYTSIRTNLNIGVRHLLPTYGFVYILLAGQLVKICASLSSKKKLLFFSFTLLTLLGWYLYENISVYPYYLTYFNQVAGGPSGGYRYVVDSNLDWGQDLKRLADWMEKNNIQKIYLDYFGWADQNYYLKDKVIGMQAGQFKNPRDFLVENPNGGYLAVSATFYMGSREKPETSYAWLENFKPVAVIGNSIFVWYITPQPSVK